LTDLMNIAYGTPPIVQFKGDDTTPTCERAVTCVAGTRE